MKRATRVYISYINFKSFNITFPACVTFPPLILDMVRSYSTGRDMVLHITLRDISSDM